MDKLSDEEKYEIGQKGDGWPNKSTYKSKIVYKGNLNKFLYDGPLNVYKPEFSTYVHEATHSFYMSYVYEYVFNIDTSYHLTFFPKDFSLAYINSKHFVLFHRPIFSSHHIIDDDFCRTHRFNYLTDRKLASNIDGVYGLFNEWHAYYHGFIASIYRTKYLIDNKLADNTLWAKALFNDDGGLLALYEFKYYIIKYLLYAKKHQTHTYNELMKHKVFLEAINELNKAMKRAESDYENLRKKAVTFSKTIPDFSIQILRNGERIIINGQQWRAGSERNDILLLKYEINLLNKELNIKELM